MTDWFQTMTSGFNADLPAGASPYQAVRDERTCSFAGVEWPAEDMSPALLASTFEGVQDNVIESVTGSAWPRCPLHGTHPVCPDETGWRCPAESHAEPGAHSWPYGSLAGLEVPPEPPRADGVVRWYLADRGWGVIAHRDGDLFVHFSAIEGPGFRELSEGQRVDVIVGYGRQGILRQAEIVRR
jgi:CspA family cold shock protein